jgi:hypothetical protein
MRRTIPVPLILLVFLSFSCGAPEQSEPTAGPKPSSKVTTVADSGSARERTQQLDHEQDQTNLGQELTNITFQTKATTEERKSFGEKFVSWISLDSPENRLINLVDADVVVIPYQKVKLRIDYPVAKPVFFLLSGAEKGFTRKQIILAISKTYHEMYDEEEKIAKIKTVPLKDRKTLANRNETDGKYGIWGHDLSDLELNSINVYESTDGTIVLDLEIDS